MIYGYITPEGQLVLASSNPTEKWALKQWFAMFAADPASVTLAIDESPEER